MIERTMLVIRPPVVALPSALQAATAGLRPAGLATHLSLPGMTLGTVTTTTAKVMFMCFYLFKDVGFISVCSG